MVTTAIVAEFMIPKWPPAVEWLTQMWCRLTVPVSQKVLTHAIGG